MTRLLLACCSLLLLSPARAQENTVSIILKLDDLTAPTPNWTRTIEYLQSRKVKASIGIIAQSLEKGKPYYLSWIKGLESTGQFEFWNHGFDHREWEEDGKKLWEFGGTSYEHQKEHFSRSQQLAKEKLGITFHTFGAPFNRTDETTAKVLSEDPDLKVYLYGKPAQGPLLPDVLILDRCQMNIENPLFVPNSQQLKHDFELLSKKQNCFVIQGHPNAWDDTRFAEFQKLVEYLIEQRVTFVTPYEYYLSKPDSKATWQKETPSIAAVPTIPAPNSGNLLVNSGFENGTSGWTIFTAPEARDIGCTLGIAEEGREGTKAAQLTSPSPARYAILQYLKGYTFAAGQHYRISAWVKAGDNFQPESGTPAFLMRASMFSAGGGNANALFYVGSGGKAVRSANTSALNGQEVPKTWTRIEGVFEIAPETVQLNACVFVAKGSGDFLVDDVGLERLDDQSPLSALQQ